MVGLFLLRCGLLLEWLVLMYFSLSDLAKLLKLLRVFRCLSVGDESGVGEKVSPLSSN